MFIMLYHIYLPYLYFCYSVIYIKNYIVRS